MASVGWRVSDERSSGNRPFTSTASSRRGQSFGFRTGVAARSNPVAVFHEKTESPGSGKSHQLCLEARRFTGIRRLRRIVRTRAVQPGRLPGGIAQLVEHLLCKQKVTGSSPVASTSLRSPRSGERRLPRRSRPRAVRGVAKAGDDSRAEPTAGHATFARRRRGAGRTGGISPFSSGV